MADAFGTEQRSSAPASSFIDSDGGLRAAIASAAICVILVDALASDQPIVFVNKQFTVQTGYSSDEALGRNCRFLQGPLTDKAAPAKIQQALIAGISVQCDLLNYRKSGETYWNSLTIDAIRDEAGTVTHFISFQHDLTREQAAIATQIEAEKQLATVMDNLPGYIFRRILHADGSITYPFLSRSLYRILGLPDETSWRGDEFIQRIHVDDRGAFLNNVRRSGSEMKRLRSEFRIAASSGTELWFRSDSTPRAGADGTVIWEGLATDVTAEKLTQNQLSYLAHHDNLTGLSNRVLFRNAVMEAIASRSPPKSEVALFYIDLDEFQLVNEELGQSFGDLVLQEIGRRLDLFARHQGGNAARLGGDEFALLLTGEAVSPGMEVVANAIKRKLLSPIDVGGHAICLEACVGAVLYVEHDDPVSCSPDERAGELMKRADLALRRAKQEGSGSERIYSAEIDDRVQNRMALRRSLQDGLTNEQFHLHYQPLVALDTGRIVGAEALVRWNHPELGMQRPDLFIPYAESSGLIVPLGAWVLKNAMQQAQTWRRQGLMTPRIAINLSGVQLQRSGFLDTVRQALDETGAEAADFEFELTEGTLIGAAGGMYKQLDGLRQLGFGLALDDFGTGHSTLRYLRDFPVDKIKIDQTFVRHLVIDSSDAAIIHAVLTLSRSLSLDVVAEGIETVMQRNFLLQEGCMVGQGYLMSMPLAAEDFGWLLAGHHRLLPAELIGTNPVAPNSDESNSHKERDTADHARAS